MDDKQTAQAATTTEAEDTRTPMEKAVAGGYQEPDEPSKEDRALTFVTALEHAVKHNAPVALSMIREARELLGIAEEVVEKVEAVEEGQGEQAPK